MSTFIKQHRKVLKSDIWKMPPLYNRVWEYLLMKTKWCSEIHPTCKKYGIHLNSGDLLTSYDIICEGVSWYEYGKQKVPNKKTIKVILDWLEFQEMIAITSNAKGTYISIVNWGTYQGRDSEKVTQKKRTAETIKEVKEVKEVKNKHIYPEWLDKDLYLAFEEMRKSIKKPLTTELAFKRSFTSLKKILDMGYSQEVVIGEAVEKNWLSFYEPKDKPKANDKLANF